MTMTDKRTTWRKEKKKCVKTITKEYEADLCEAPYQHCYNVATRIVRMRKDEMYNGEWVNMWYLCTSCFNLFDTRTIDSVTKIDEG